MLEAVFEARSSVGQGDVVEPPGTPVRNVGTQAQVELVDLVISLVAGVLATAAFRAGVQDGIAAQV